MGRKKKSLTVIDGTKPMAPKFVYSDCSEVDENLNSLTYGEGFAFGYGKYRTENYAGRDYQVAIAQNINPKTIRHIVGVPNHFRAWDREFYHSIGGHNRRLTIADDYELLIRSFLKTNTVALCCNASNNILAGCNASNNILAGSVHLYEFLPFFGYYLPPQSHSSLALKMLT